MTEEYFFVKSSWKKAADVPKKISGVDLVFEGDNPNAFTTFADAVEKVKADAPLNDVCIVVLDKKLAVTDSYLESLEEVTVTSNLDNKITGILDIEGTEINSDFENFLTVSVAENTVVNGAISNKVFKRTFHSKTDYPKNVSFSAAGSVTVAGKAGDISGYKTVKLLEGATAGRIYACQNQMVMGEYKVSGDKKGNMTSAKNSVSGSVTVAAGSTVNEIVGYKNVTAAGGRLGSVTGMMNGWLFDRDLSTGCWYIAPHSAPFGKLVTDISISDKMDWEKLNGTLQISQAAAFTGTTAKFTDSTEVGAVSNVANVTLTDSNCTGFITVGARSNSYSKYTCTNKLEKQGVCFGVYELKESRDSIGGVTAVNSYVAGNITGYRTIKITQSDVAGSITGVANYSNIEKYESGKFDNSNDLQDFVDKPTEFGTLIAKTEKSAAAGLVNISVSKKADDADYLEVSGSISGFKDVTVSGQYIGSGEDAYGAAVVEDVVTTHTWSRTLTAGVVSDDVKSTKKGSMTSSVKLSNAGKFNLSLGMVGGDITGFKTVSIARESSWGGSVYAYNTEELGELVIGREAASYEWNKKETFAVKANGGKRTVKTSEKFAAAGSFTAVDSYWEGEDDSCISGFNTVTLTNTSAGIIDTSVTGSTVLTDVYEYDSYQDCTEGLFSTMTSNCTVTSQATGKMTMKINKKACDDAYEVGAVSNFLNVDIAGFSGVIDGEKVIKSVTVNGSITGVASVQTVQSWSYNNGDEAPVADENAKVNYTKAVAAGSAKLSNVEVDGSIANYATVNLTAARVSGDVYTGSSMEKFDLGFKKDTNGDWIVDPDSTETVSKYKSVAGALNLSDAVIEGDVSGFKTVKVKAGSNFIGSYKGTAVASTDEERISGNFAEAVKDAKETITIAKNSVLLVVEGGIELQAEDKLTVDGELVLWGDARNSGPVTFAVIEDPYTPPVFGGITEIGGKGTIFSNSTAAAALREMTKAKVVDLGETSRYFTGSANELLDNEDAVSWDGEEDITGWVGMFEEEGTFTDKTDKIIWECENTVELEFNFWGNPYDFEVVVGGDTWDFESPCTVEAGEVIEITRTGLGSTSYQISVING